MPQYKSILHSSVRIAIFLYASLAHSANAINNLLKKSDTVVIAAPTAFTTGSAGIMVNLSIIQWLSSPPPNANATVQVLCNASSLEQKATLAATKPILGLWFLKSQGNGTYAAVRVTAGKPTGFQDLYFTAADRGTCPSTMAYSTDSVLSDSIALELGCAAITEKDEVSMRSGDMVGATYDLGGSLPVHNAFLYLAQLPGPRQKAIGIGGLISAKDIQGLSLLEQNLQAFSASDTRIAMQPIALWREPAPAALRIIGRVATSASVTDEISLQSATRALCTIHSKDTLRYLRGLLDSPSRMAKIDAMLGLTAFLTGLPIHTQENTLTMEFMKPSPTPYSNDPTWRGGPDVSRNSTDAEVQAAATFWKGWLQTHPELFQ